VLSELRVTGKADSRITMLMRDRFADVMQAARVAISAFELKT